MVPGKEIVPMALPGERAVVPVGDPGAEKDRNKGRVPAGAGNGQQQAVAEASVSVANEATEAQSPISPPAQDLEKETETSVRASAPASLTADQGVFEPRMEMEERHSVAKSTSIDSAVLPEPLKEAKKTAGEFINELPKKLKPEPPSGANSTNGIVYIKPNADVPMVLNRSDVIAQEAFGILRSRLLKAHETGLQAILFTSAEQGEGKTVMAVNAAMSLAQLGQKRILLIDGDLRVCGVTEFLSLGGRPGLSEWLRKEKPLEAVLHATNLPNLSIVPAGHTPEGMLPEALEGSRWSEFIATMKEKFDLILVDSLPVSAPVVDLELLLAPCDAYLVTVQIGKTSRNSMRKLAHWADPQKLLGIIVNNADKLSDGSYHYGYYGAKYKKK